MIEKEMYLPRPLYLHVKLISLFCMQIRSGHMTRLTRIDCVFVFFLHKDIESALKVFFFNISEVHA